MLIYPQLGNGAMSQFPIRKTHHSRTVVNRAADGSVIKLADAAGRTTEWTLPYADLSDAEAAMLQDFFAAAEGSLNGFTFLDPVGNLLASSADLEDQVWQKDPFLTVAGARLGPQGDPNAWTIANSGAGSQSLTQTVAAPGGYQYCYSAYLRSDQALTIHLLAGSDDRSYRIGSGWNRVVLPTVSGADAESIQIGVEVPAMGVIDVFGMQLEAQAGSSGYKATTRGGVYEDAHLRDDVLRITKTGFNRSSCTVNIFHANHL